MIGPGRPTARVWPSGCFKWAGPMTERPGPPTARSSDATALGLGFPGPIVLPIPHSPCLAPWLPGSLALLHAEGALLSAERRGLGMESGMRWPPPSLLLPPPIDSGRVRKARQPNTGMVTEWLVVLGQSSRDEPPFLPSRRSLPGCDLCLCLESRAVIDRAMPRRDWLRALVAGFLLVCEAGANGTQLQRQHGIKSRISLLSSFSHPLSVACERR